MRGTRRRNVSPTPHPGRMGCCVPDRGRHSRAHLPPANVHSPVGTIRAINVVRCLGPNGAKEISQMQASPRARYLEPSAKQVTRRRCVGPRVNPMTTQNVIDRNHRPIRGAWDVVSETGGAIRRLNCPRLMSIVPSGRFGPSTLCVVSAPTGPRKLARCKRARERGAWNRTQNNSRAGGALDNASTR